jgi:hypothetical protein
MSLLLVILCYLHKLWHLEVEQQLCYVIAKHNLEWHLAYKNNGSNMYRNEQEASGMLET